MTRVRVAVIGGGPAGLAAAIAAAEDGASVLLIEKDARLGGALKQAICDDFGFLRYEERLTGPEYAFRDIDILHQTNCIVMLQTFVTRIDRVNNAFHLTMSNRHGIVRIEAGTVVLATGCREYTAKEMGIHGTRPSGVFTAGSAQYYLNVLGQLPSKNCIIFGSSNIGLSMARQLKIEGADVLAMYEKSSRALGFPYKISQCLYDFETPFHTRHAVTRIFGAQRIRGVEVFGLDSREAPVKGTESAVRCDGLLIATGLTPENKLADSLGVPICELSRGPFCDQRNMTVVDGLFSCGNSLHVNSCVDYISECGRNAGLNAARYMERARTLIRVKAGKDFQHIIPQYIDIDSVNIQADVYFRTSQKHEKATVKVLLGNEPIFSQDFVLIHPSKTYKLAVNFESALTPNSNIQITIDRAPQPVHVGGTT